MAVTEYSGSALMSLPEVARYLGMSERAIYGWAQTGMIPAFKLGAAWRFRLSEIDAWLESQRSCPDVSSGKPPLVRPSEPQRTGWRTRRQQEQARRALVEECIDLIETAMRLEDRTVFTIDRFVDNRRGEYVVNEAVEQLRKQKKLDVSEIRTPDGEKIKVIERRR